MNTNQLDTSWYETESDFDAVMAMLPVEESQRTSSYAEFVIGLLKREKDLKKLGVTTHRIAIKPAAIKKWSETHQRTICHDSIASYRKERFAFLLLAS